MASRRRYVGYRSSYFPATLLTLYLTTAQRAHLSIPFLSLPFTVFLLVTFKSNYYYVKRLCALCC